MRLTYRTKKILDCVMVISLIVVVSVVFAVLSRSTFAEGNDSSVAQEVLSAKYVTFYDGEDKLTVKTEARTVADAIERANIVINDGDKVEPGLDTEIMADNFHINIYRARPVVVRDGSVEKYIMTANAADASCQNNQRSMKTRRYNSLRRCICEPPIRRKKHERSYHQDWSSYKKVK